MGRHWTILLLCISLATPPAEADYHFNANLLGIPVQLSVGGEAASPPRNGTGLSAPQTPSEQLDAALKATPINRERVRKAAGAIAAANQAGCEQSSGSAKEASKAAQGILNKINGERDDGGNPITPGSGELAAAKSKADKLGEQVFQADQRRTAGDKGPPEPAPSVNKPTTATEKTAADVNPAPAPAPAPKSPEAAKQPEKPKTPELLRDEYNDLASSVKRRNGELKRISANLCPSQVDQFTDAALENLALGESLGKIAPTLADLLPKQKPGAAPVPSPSPQIVFVPQQQQQQNQQNQQAQNENDPNQNNVAANDAATPPGGDGMGKGGMGGQSSAQKDGPKPPDVGGKGLQVSALMVPEPPKKSDADKSTFESLGPRKPDYAAAKPADTSVASNGQSNLPQTSFQRPNPRPAKLRKAGVRRRPR